MITFIVLGMQSTDGKSLAHTWRRELSSEDNGGFVRKNMKEIGDKTSV